MNTSNNNVNPAVNPTPVINTDPTSAPVTPGGQTIEITEISEGVFRATTQASRYIVEYDINKCIGAASCAAIAPLTFFMNEENKAELVKDGTWDDDDTILSAAQSCPVFAIKIILKETEEIIFPIDEIY